MPSIGGRAKERFGRALALGRNDRKPDDFFLRGGQAMAFENRTSVVFSRGFSAALAICAAVLLGGGLAHAQAVSQPNGKVALQGGHASFGGIDKGYVLVDGSFAFPLMERFGMQLDGGAGYLAGRLTAGAAAQMFWRDPKIGLVGATAQHTTIGRDGLTRAGVIAEAYVGPVNIAPYAGYQWSDRGRRLVLGSGFYGGADVDLYVTKNLMLSAGAGVFAKRFEGRAGAEFQPDIAKAPGLAFFVGGTIGENNGWSVGGGVRYYFARDDKPLNRRHREDDPRSRLWYGVSGAAKVKTGVPAQQQPPPPPPPPPDGCTQDDCNTDPPVEPPPPPPPPPDCERDECDPEPPPPPPPPPDECERQECDPEPPPPPPPGCEPDQCPSTD